MWTHYIFLAASDFQMISWLSLSVCHELESSFFSVLIADILNGWQDEWVDRKKDEGKF